jgi:DNA-binding Lrp family transcriptional regulator
MPVVGYMLISTSAGMEKKVWGKLGRIKEVTERHMLSGEYDMIVKVTVSNPNDIKNILTNKVKSIPGIVDVCSLLGTTQMK